ncbi:MAG: HEAT repeat domain-containing protein, partial [Fibrella sp.]|nr:HEAT repeat domain-containing protein [Armatimonadota bacterium]
MRVQAGGGATIYGIHYQMLWCLLTVASMRVSSPVNTDGEISQATLVLEPSNGGDAILREADVEQVVQLKARSDASAWSLHDVVDAVLPDLYRAVRFDREHKFIFLTEGHVGEWVEVYEFFQRLHGHIDVPPDGPLPPLVESGQLLRFRGNLVPPVRDRGEDDSGQVSRRNEWTSLSENELLEQMVTLLHARHPHIRRDSREETRRKLLWILSRFEFRGGRTERYLRTQLSAHLRSLVDNPDEVMVTMRSLLQDLGERAMAGNAPIQAGAFFAEHRIRGVPLTRHQWPRLIEVAESRLRHVLAHRFEYDPSEDVRPGGATLLATTEVDSWRRGGAGCLALQGESGQGKSWRLCSLALALAEEAPVVLVSAEGEPGQIVERAAHEFWFGVCNHGGTMQLEQIGRLLDQTNTVAPGTTWLYLLVDGVQMPQDADLLCREVAGIRGVRLAFTTSERTAEHLGQNPGPPTIIAMRVHNFTEPELRQYITGGDAVRWHSIGDAEVKRIIAYPLLAYIYRNLPGARDWKGTNEYRLYDAYLSGRILGRLSESDSFTAEIAFNRAGLSLWNNERYPWSPEQMAAFGFDKDLIAALRGVDFLHWDTEQMRYKVRHDRLKEWLAARALSRALEYGDRDAVEVGARFKSILFPDVWHRDSEGDRERDMRYVPMDVVWHLAQRSKKSANSAAAAVLNTLLLQLESESTHFRTAEVLYEGYLSTVGPEIAPILFRRLIQLANDDEVDDSSTRVAITNCLAGMDERDVSPTATQLLHDAAEEVRYAAAIILAKCPVAEALPALWNRVTALTTELAAVAARSDASALVDDMERGGSFANPTYAIDRELSMVRRALRACVPLSPEWLTGQLASLPTSTAVTPATENVHDLIALLRFTKDQGRRWHQSKEVARSWTETDDPDFNRFCEQE